jgi:hypothetical protein
MIYLFQFYTFYIDEMFLIVAFSWYENEQLDLDNLIILSFKIRLWKKEMLDFFIPLFDIPSRSFDSVFKCFSLQMQCWFLPLYMQLQASSLNFPLRVRIYTTQGEELLSWLFNLHNSVSPHILI